MRKHLLIFIFVIAVSSCQYLDRRPSKDALVNEELKSINWKEVDEFPTVSDCDSIQDKMMQRQCFFDFLAQVVQQKLSAETLSILYPELDTIEVVVTVFPDSTLQFQPRFPKDSVAYDTKIIDSIIHNRLTDFPKIKPAIKRGIPVKSQFVLPVILKVE